MEELHDVREVYKFEVVDRLNGIGESWEVIHESERGTCILRKKINENEIPKDDSEMFYNKTTGENVNLIEITEEIIGAITGRCILTISSTGYTLYRLNLV